MRSYLLGGACAASMLLALAPVAQAADIDIAPEPMGMGWYVSVFGGWSHAKDESGDFHWSSDNYYFDLELDDGFTAGIALGAQINEWLRGEVELSGNWHDAEGVLASSALVPSTWTVDGDETALFALANLWLEVPIGLGPLRPYAGGGVGFGRLDLDIETSGGSTLFDDADWGFAWQLGAGVAFGVSDNVAIDLGYRYKRIENADIEVHDDWGGDDEVEKDYKSHNFLVGVRFGF
jgi:opacity protein-like surface antigen